MKKQIAVIGLALSVVFAASFVPGDDAALTNEDIVRLTQAEMGTEVIIAKIQASTTDFDTSVEQLLELKGAGVEDSVLAAMVNKGAAAPARAETPPDEEESFIITYPAPETVPASPTDTATPAARAAPQAVPTAPAVPAPVIPVAGSSFRDRLSSGGEGPEMVVIPAGRFRMGDLAGARDNDEKPVHEVVIARPFAVSKYEVTFEDYDKFTYPNKVDDEGWGRGRRPIINISWDDAMEYAAWLSAQTGNRYRLPTEAEWEYAARAGSNTKYHFGNNEAQLCQYGNHADTSTDYEWRNTACSDGVGKGTAEVGRYRPNAFGLYDMHGNVHEWVQDCWNKSYAGAPRDGNAWTSGDCSQRVVRGGSWFYTPWLLRSALRDRGPPLVPLQQPGVSFGPGLVERRHICRSISTVQAGRIPFLLWTFSLFIRRAAPARVFLRR